MIPAIEMKLIDIDSIHVDPSYQRDLDEKRVKKIAAKFRQGAAKAVSLSRRPMDRFGATTASTR